MDAQMLSFQIIAAVGASRSNYIEAIHAARDGEYDRAAKLIEDGKAEFLKGHDIHTSLVQEAARGESSGMDILLTHAEDQLMSAEGFGILADEFVSVYRKVDALKDSKEA